MLSNSRESQRECLDTISKAEVSIDEEFAQVMEKLPEYIAKVKRIEADMKACNKLVEKMKKKQVNL